MSDTPRELIIIGLTESGTTFRPSDRAERLCGVTAPFAPAACNGWSPYVRPNAAMGVKFVVIDRQVEQMEPAAVEFLLDFAGDNDLRVRRRRDERRPEGKATLLATHGASNDA